MASGFNRAVKPEILFPGGQQFYLSPVGNSTDPGRFAIVPTLQPPGQKVAWPGLAPMELGKMVFTRGTSNATALATRCAAEIYEQLQELKIRPEATNSTKKASPSSSRRCWCMGHAWGNAADTIKTALTTANTDWRQTQRLQARFLGYGEVAPERTLVSTDHTDNSRLGRAAREKLMYSRFPYPSASAPANRSDGLPLR